MKNPLPLVALLGRMVPKSGARTRGHPGQGGTPRTLVAVDLANLAHMLAPVRDKGMDMDYCRLLRWLAQDRSVVAARIYTGLDDSKPAIRSFLRRLQKIGYEVVRSCGKSYSDGSVKRPNADVPLVTDLLAGVDAFDEAVLVSGDGDFAYPVRRLLEMGKRVRIMTTRHHLAQSLRESGAEVVYLEKEWATLLVARHMPQRW